MKWRRRWSHILLGIISLLLLAQVFLKIWLNPIVERMITRSVPLLTEGVYRVDSLDINIRILARTVNVRNFTVSVDSMSGADLSSLEQSPHLVNLRIGELSLRNLDIMRFLYNKELALNRLHFTNPIMHLRIPNLSEEKVGLQGGNVTRERNPDLYPLIAPILKGIYINSFEWVSGQLLVDELGAKLAKPIQAKEISLSLSNIEIDSTSFARSGRPLYSERLSFQLDITDYTVVLPDSQYQIQAGELYYTNESSTVQIDSLLMFPFEKLGSTTEAPLEIEIPRLVMQGIHPGEILFDRYFGLDSLLIYQPRISLSPTAQSGPRSSFLTQNPNELYPLISDGLDALHLDYLGLLGGEFRSQGNRKDSIPSMEVRDMDLHFSNITIDSTTSLRKDRLFCTEEITIEVDRFSFFLNQNDLLLTGGQVGYQTSKQHFSLKELAAIPKDLEAPTILSGGIPSIEIEGLDLVEFWIEKQLDIKRISIESPEIEYADFPNRRKENLDAIAKARPDTLLEEVLRGLNVDQLSVSGGSFLLNDHIRSPKNAFKAQDINVKVDSFQLEDLVDKELGRLFYANEVAVEFEVSDYFLLLPDSSYAIRFPRLWISSTDSVLIADSLEVQPQKLGEEVAQNFSIEIPQLKIKGWDPYDLYFYRRMSLDSIVLKSPFIRQRVFKKDSSQALPELADLDLYPFIQKQLDTLSIHYLGLQQTHFEGIDFQGNSQDTLRIPPIDLQVVDFQLGPSSKMDSENVFYASDIQVDVYPYSVPLPNQGGTVSWEQVRFSTRRQSIQLEGVNLEEEQRGDSSSLQVSVPQVQIGGVDVYEILVSKEIAIKEVRIKDPFVAVPFELKLPDAQEDSLPPIDLFPLIEPVVSLLAIDSFLIEGGNLDLVNPIDAKRRLQISDISFNVEGFLLDSLAQARSTKPFYADHIDLQADVPPYSIVLPDSSYRIEFRDIDLSTTDSTLSIDSLRLEPLAGSREDALEVDLLLDKLELTGVNLTELYFEQKLDLSTLRLVKPQILLIVNQANRERMGERQGFDQRTFITEDPYPQLSEVFDYVDIERVELEQGRIVVSGEGIRPFGIPSFSIMAQHFRLDSLAYELLDDTYLFSDELTLVVRNIELPLPDSSMYRMNLGELGLSTQNRYLYVNNFELLPKYGRYEFGRIKNEVVDRWNLSNRRLELRDLDVSLLLRNQSLKAGELRLRDPQLEIFKDKRYPFPYKRPKMPWEELRELSTYLHLDSITVSNASIFYEERNVETDTTAWFKLNELDASLSPVSNDSFLLMQNPEMYLHATAMIMDTALLDFRAFIPYTDTSNYHTIEADVFDLPAVSLNPIIERTAAIRAMDGNIHKVYFRFRADNQVSRGKMKMRYNDLKVNLLNPKPQKKRGIGRLFGSMFANTFVVHSDNPRRFLRVGRIEFEREKNKGFLVYWIKSIVDGVKSSIGIGKKEEKELE